MSSPNPNYEQSNNDGRNWMPIFLRMNAHFSAINNLQENENCSLEDTLFIKKK